MQSCKAAREPLLCSGGIVCYIHHRYCLKRCSSALWDGRCTHALLLPDCALLNGSRGLYRKLVAVFKPGIKWYLPIAMAICWGACDGPNRELVKMNCTLVTLYFMFLLNILSLHAVILIFIVVFSHAPHYQNYIHPQL